MNAPPGVRWIEREAPYLVVIAGLSRLAGLLLALQVKPSTRGSLARNSFSPGGWRLFPRSNDE